MQEEYRTAGIDSASAETLTVTNHSTATTQALKDLYPASHEVKEENLNNLARSKISIHLRGADNMIPHKNLELTRPGLPNSRYKKTFCLSSRTELLFSLSMTAKKQTVL